MSLKKSEGNHKLYCCTNSARVESKVLGIIDVILHLIYLMLSIWLSDLVKNHLEYLKTLTNTNGTYCEINKLYEKIEEREDSLNWLLASLIIYSVWGMVLGAVLLTGAQIRKQVVLKVWFVFTILNLCLGLYASVTVVINVYHKLPPIIIISVGHLYTWYEMWIVFCLIRELKSSSTVTILGTQDDGGEKATLPPEVHILDPTPTPSKVYTIEEDSKSMHSEKNV